jgi:threonine aldolase
MKLFDPAATAAAAPHLHPRGFASDNNAGICPEAWEAMSRANRDHAISYGDDPWTSRAADLLREIFEIDCEVFFVFNGTAANSLVLGHLCRSFHSVICSGMAHIETDECGAPEFFTGGTKLLHVSASDGKLDIDAIHRLVTSRKDIHYPKPRVISVTQPTECGTVYSIDELHAIREAAQRHHLRVHMDGARFANAVASLKVAPKEVSWKAGVDVLCFGCTKLGAPVGEAILFFDKTMAAEFDYRCKQAGQLASKMRFLAAPLVGMLETGAWLKHAGHANAMAQRLARGFEQIPGAKLAYPVQANAVFVHMHPKMGEHLKQRGWRLYNFIAGAYRCMCSWDTTEADVDALLKDAAEFVNATT